MIRVTLAIVAAVALTGFQDERKARLPEGVEVERDIEYGKGGDVSLKLDLCRPKEKAKDLMPAVLWIHGGGWRGGDKRDGRNAGNAAMLAQRGYVVVSVNYRLSDLAPFPAAVEDVKCAVRWLRKNAEKYGIDPDRIGAWGGSAGGHLALMLAVADDKAGLEGKGGNEGVSSRVKAACSWFGPADLTVDEKDFVDPGGVVKFFLGGEQKDIPDVYKRASPATHVSADDPPVLMIHGEKDNVVPIGQSEIMLKKLREAKVEAALIRVKDAGHGFKPSGGGEPSPSRDEILKSTLDFFDKHLKH